MTEASKYIKVKDGSLAFRKDEFRSSHVRDVNMFTATPELVIFTDTWTTGRIIRYKTLEEAVDANKQIQEQLG